MPGTTGAARATTPDNELVILADDEDDDAIAALILLCVVIVALSASAESAEGTPLASVGRRAEAEEDHASEPPAEGHSQPPRARDKVGETV